MFEIHNIDGHKRYVYDKSILSWNSDNNFSSSFINTKLQKKFKRSTAPISLFEPNPKYQNKREPKNRQSLTRNVDDQIHIKQCPSTKIEFYRNDDSEEDDDEILEENESGETVTEDNLVPTNNNIDIEDEPSDHSPEEVEEHDPIDNEEEDISNLDSTNADGHLVPIAIDEHNEEENHEINPVKQSTTQKTSIPLNKNRKVNCPFKNRKKFDEHFWKSVIENELKIALAECCENCKAQTIEKLSQRLMGIQKNISITLDAHYKDIVGLLGSPLKSTTTLIDDSANENNVVQSTKNNLIRVHVDPNVGKKFKRIVLNISDDDNKFDVENESQLNKHDDGLNIEQNQRTVYLPRKISRVKVNARTNRRCNKNNFKSNKASPMQTNER